MEICSVELCFIWTRKFHLKSSHKFDSISIFICYEVKWIQSTLWKRHSSTPEVLKASYFYYHLLVDITFQNRYYDSILIAFSLIEDHLPTICATSLVIESLYLWSNAPSIRLKPSSAIRANVNNPSICYDFFSLLFVCEL